MRMYVGKALSAAEMHAVEMQATPKLWQLRYFPDGKQTPEEFAAADMRHLYRCTTLNDMAMKDSTWTDIYDHRYGRCSRSPWPCLLAAMPWAQCRDARGLALSL